MKKFFLLICFPALLYSQIPSNVFPKIGFCDWFKFNANLHSAYQQVLDSTFYYARLKEVGFNYMTTFGRDPNTHILNPTLQDPNGLGIFDETIDFQETRNNTDFLLFPYSRGSGNFNDELPYESGGPRSDPVSSGTLWGFGNANNTTCWINPASTSPQFNTDYPDNSRRVFFAQYGQSEGTLLVARPEPMHQIRQKLSDIWPVEYELCINARIDTRQAPPGEIVAEVNVSEVQWSNNPINDYYIPDEIKQEYVNFENPPTEDLLNVTYEIRAEDFNGNNYTDIKLGPFVKTTDYNYLFEIVVTWKNKRSLYIDKIDIYDNYYKKLFVDIDPDLISNINSQLQGTFSDIVNYDNFTDVYIDEPLPWSYRSNKFVEDMTRSWSHPKYINGAAGYYPTNWLAQANYQKRPEYVMTDYYPFKWAGPPINNYVTYATTDVQSALDELIAHKPWVQYDVSCGLRSGIEWAHNFNADVLTDDILFYPFIQVAAEAWIDSNGDWKMGQRAPTREEIFTQANLALAYGAKGFQYYAIWTVTDGLPDSPPFSACWGLFDDSQTPFDPDVNNPDWWKVRQAKENPYVKNQRFDAVKELNHRISLIEDEIMELTWTDGYNIHLLQFPSGKYITGIQSYYGEPQTSDPPEETYIELGLFKETAEYNNDNKENFFIVNRRTGSDGSDANRTIRVNINKSGVGDWNNWGIKEIGTENTWTIGEIGQFETEYEPGEGKLFRLEPVVMGGGRLAYNETITGTVELHGDLYVESELTVNGEYHCYNDIYLTGSLLGSGSIVFHNGAKLIIADNLAMIWGDVSEKLTLDFENQNNYSGIYVLTGSYLHMLNAFVKNSGVGIQTDRNFYKVDLSYVDFQDCGEGGYYCVNFAGPSTIRPFVGHCTFNNCYGAVLAVNLSEIQIQESQINDCDAGIYLSNIPQANIISNNLTSAKKTLPGIFLSSCNGLIRHNSVSGHTNGIFLANSSPDIGDNLIEHNLYHGIYIGTGSKPDMHAELFTENPEYYTISGYNTLLENGGTTQGGPPDNDGSEIYFGSTISNANMEKGCNSIIDDRSPGADHPPYNTRLLMNSPYYLNPLTIHAERNYWSENPLYPLNQRFGNLNVYYSPILSDPCDGFGSKSLLITDSEGEVFDTIYSINREVENLSNTDILYSKAEEFYLTAEYEAANQVYQQITTSNETLPVKQLAFQRLYETGKITGKSNAYFDNLHSELNSARQNVSDSILQKKFSQLASLSLVGGQEYIPAIGEFDNVISEHPGTEEALFAEIDALTTALLIEPGDTMLGKTIAGKYNLDPNEYSQRIDELIRKNWGAKEETNETIIPTDYSLYNNYPNPFNPTTTIRFDIPERTNVELVVYDILGRKVKSLVNNETRNPGRYEVSFNASELASGVYIYKLIAKNYSLARKMLLVK